MPIGSQKAQIGREGFAPLWSSVYRTASMFGSGLALLATADWSNIKTAGFLVSNPSRYVLM